MKKPQLMGILNVTPDSFSDGAAFLMRRAFFGRSITIAEIAC